ncbi:MAG: hypothetical protein OEX97_02620 [Acidimicrobiia bacterium]|nr:hypothetical protein [Acidimicrobiia bacterium]
MPVPPTASTVPPTTIPTIEPVDGFTRLPVPDETDPFTLDSVTFGDSGLVYSGNTSPTSRDHPNEATLWHFDGTEWSRSLVGDVTTDEYWGTPWVTNVEYWDGRYLAFLQGDATAPESTASMLTSDDGRTWKLEHILPDRTAGGSPGGVFATPESPPWPGSAGIAGVTTTADEIFAVGWVTTSEGSTATIWRSDDGREWHLTPIPNALWPNEWANRVSVGPSGWLVAGAGPVHSNSLLWYSPDGEEWTYVGDLIGDEADAWGSFGEVASGSDGLAVAATDMNRDLSTTIWRSDDGMAWTQVDEPGATVRTVLTSDGSTMTKLWQDDRMMVVEISRDGSTWEAVTTLPNGDDSRETFHTWVTLGHLGERLSVTRFITPEDYSSASVELWVDAPEAGVVLVESDDTLNVRSGPSATIVAELHPTTNRIQMTGRTDGAAGSLWVEIIHDQVIGWVNSFYVTEAVDSIPSDDALQAVENFAEEVFRSGRPLGSITGRKGLTVTHFDGPKHFNRDSDPMTDPTIFLWGSPGCGVEPECAYQETFVEQVAGGFLSAWDDDDRLVEIDTPIAGGNGTLPEFVIPTVFRNFHYVAVHDPGDDPAYGGLDWTTWYVYLELADGELTVAGLSVDMWAP